MKYREIVKLRERRLPSGVVALYLDTTIAGERRRESLHLYLYPDTPEENRRTLALASEVKAQRLLDLRDNLYGFAENTQEKRDRYVLPYFDRLMSERTDINNYNKNHNWRDCYRMLIAYMRNRDITFNQVTERWCNGFKKFLLNQPLSQNSKWAYFTRFKTFLNNAAKDGLIDYSLSQRVTQLKQEHKERVFLTIEELNTLVQSGITGKASLKNLKRMFLFACFTSLRISDIKALRWKNVSEVNGYTRITFVAQKTKKLKYLDIPPQAVELMGERKRDEDKVFDYTGNGSATDGQRLREWCRANGINKQITFHSSRHTFATMMLELGEPLTVVSKILDHSEITTTQIYEHILDKDIRRAMNSIPIKIK